MLKAVDLFCGAGGSSAGARSAGAEILFGVDVWDRAVDTFAANFADAEARIERLHAKSRPPRSMRSAGIDLLLASPECTNHSCAKGAKPRDEESRRSAQYVLGYAKALAPRWIIIENVIQMRNWSGFSGLCSDLDSLGYKLRTQVLDAVDFGVPQTRRRMFLLCDRKAEPRVVAPKRIFAPRPASSIVKLDGPWLSQPLYSSRRAAPTLARAERAIAELGRSEPFLIVYYGSDGSGGWQPLDRPLRTLTTLDRFGLVTWRGRTPMLRMLQVEELKRAMGFRSGFRLPVGSRREQIMLLGNAVCPPVMQAVVSSLCASAVSVRSAA